MSWRFEDSLAALRHRDFRRFAIGQFISLIGFWMQSVGQSWLVYRLTQSSAYLGAIVFCQQVPILMFSFAAGGLVDRSNRRRVVILTQFLALIQASVLTILTYTGRITIPHLFFLAFLLGLVSAVDLPARQAFLIQMVGKEDLTNGIAINSSMFNGARMVGPAVAGYVVAHWGEAACFAMNAVTYAPVLIVLLSMKLAPGVAGGNGKGLWEDLAEGFRFVREHRPLRVLLMLLGAMGTAGFPFVVLLPVFADRIFGRGATGLGWLMTGVGLGALVGALFLAGRKGLSGLSRVISVSTISFALSVGLFAVCPYFWPAFVLLCATGLFMMITVAAINTTIQSMIPDALRGRIMSLFTTMLIGMAPVGSFLAGGLANYLGVQTTVVLMALVCLFAGVAFYRSVPSIVREARDLYRLQNIPPVP